MNSSATSRTLLDLRADVLDHAIAVGTQRHHRHLLDQRLVAPLLERELLVPLHILGGVEHDRLHHPGATIRVIDRNQRSSPSARRHW